ncbi:hypothetical protein Y032_0088g2175 [Ancylostoma ceylanicum]|uniref:Uncharacterized protein n=1 Tax=Ancylostoma ceylanicum TaxID=53326 RepID=A0A016TPI9_9BILA|nr:hypothetical protein Y032_0088g2175 [Ancylostoma ceylanicum]
MLGQGHFWVLCSTSRLMLYTAIQTRCMRQTNASICGRLSMKTGQRGMYFFDKKNTPVLQAANECVSAASTMRLVLSFII